MLAVCYLTLATAWEVVGRYMLRAPSSWAPDTAAVSFALVTFLAAPRLTQQGGHAVMSAVVDAIPVGFERWVRRTTLVIGALVCGLCAWFGAVETLRLQQQGVSMIAATPIPKWWVMAAIVYGLASMSLHFMRHLLRSFADAGDPEDGGRS